MESIKVDKHDLVDKLVANRELHRLEFDKLHDVWIAAVKANLEDLMAMDDGTWSERSLQISSRFPEPHSHLDAFDTVIEMLGWHTSDTVELAEYEFQQYVQNQWAWRPAFKMATAQYNMES